MLTILVGILLASGIVTAQTGQATDVTGSISGIVKDAVSGTPVANVVVTIVTLPRVANGAVITTGTSKRHTVTTDVKGRYQFTDLPSGQFFAFARTKDRAAPPAARMVNLRAGQSLASIDFVLRPYGVISGKVLDDKREPVPEAMVCAISREYHFGALQYLAKINTTTDDTGRYVLPLLEPGRSYVIRADKRERQAISEVPVDPKLRRRALTPTYHPNSDMIETGVPLVLRSGEHREGVDIEMSRAESYCIDGTLEIGGRPAALHFWVVEQALSAGAGFKPGGTSGPDGRFRVCGLQPGQYRITAYEILPSPTGDPPHFGSITVTIADADVRDVKVVAHGGLKLSGEVVWDGSPPDNPVTAKILVSLWPVNRIHLMGEKMDPHAPIPGQFIFPDILMDDYVVITGNTSLPGVYVKDILYAGRSVRNKPLHLGSAIPGAVLRIVLARDGGSLTAKVADEDGNPVPDSYVLILPGGAYSEADVAAALISAHTDQDGTYSSETLAPGKYYLVASATEIASTPESINRLWRMHLSKAKEVEISPNASVQVTLAPIEIQ